MARVRAGKTFTPEQERWLGLIRDHLVENLAIEQADFDLIAFTRTGAAWGRVVGYVVRDALKILDELDEED